MSYPSDTTATVAPVRPGRHWYLVVALVVALGFFVAMAFLAATNDESDMDDMDDMPGMDMGLGDAGRG